MSVELLILTQAFAQFLVLLSDICFMVWEDCIGIEGPDELPVTGKGQEAKVWCESYLAVLTVNISQ